MKRSKFITLTLLAGAAVYGVSNAINTKEDGQIVQTPEQCMQVTGNSAQWCGDALQKAQAEAVKTAPKFATREECAAEFGESACQQQTDPAASVSHGGVGSFFMPLATGYFLSNMLNGSRNAFTAEPAYRTANGNVHTGNSYRESRLYGGRAGSASRAGVSRGGFGGGYRGSFGG